MIQTKYGKVETWKRATSALEVFKNGSLRYEVWRDPFAGDKHYYYADKVCIVYSSDKHYEYGYEEIRSHFKKHVQDYLSTNPMPLALWLKKENLF